MATYRGGCATLSEAGVDAGECCSTCHHDEDAEEGGLFFRYLPDGSYLEVCCLVSAYLDMADRDVVLAALLKKDTE